jgi:ligand-binding sensor domain-containing protein
VIVLALVLIVLAGGVWEVAAQRLPLRTYSSADGLAGDHVSALLPDSYGFLWIGTNTGLSRFDGARVPHVWRQRRASASLDQCTARIGWKEAHNSPGVVDPALR